eukprot:COSAG02_NODE_2063_length_9965_cov_116.411920_11_plen_71_part_00
MRSGTKSASLGGRGWWEGTDPGLASLRVGPEESLRNTRARRIQGTLRENQGGVVLDYSVNPAAHPAFDAP